MLLKTSNATDYSGVFNPTVTPRPAVEFLQTVVLADFNYVNTTTLQSGAGGTGWGATIIAVDAPSWANFKRYKRIQFSFGGFGASASDTLNMNTRRNGIVYSGTKYATREAITAATPTVAWTSASVTTAVPLAATVTASTGAIRQLDIYLTQLGGYAECFQGDNAAVLIAGNINRTNFSMRHDGNAALPGYLDTDVPGVQLAYTTATTLFRPMRINGATQQTDYTLECNIYGWLR